MSGFDFQVGLVVTGAVALGHTCQFVQALSQFVLSGKESEHIAIVYYDVILLQHTVDVILLQHTVASIILL